MTIGDSPKGKGTGKGKGKNSKPLSASPVQQVTQNLVCSWSVSHSKSWQLPKKLLC